MKHTIIAALAVLTLAGTAFTAAPAAVQENTLVVDGVEYSSTKETPGTVHWYTPTPNPKSAAYGEQVWNGKNGAEHLPCEGLVHWVSNRSRLVISHCEESTPTTVPETTVPETTVPETTVPETTVPETTVPETTVPDDTRNCTELLAAGIQDIPGGDPLYRLELDRDQDGIACESGAPVVETSSTVIVNEEVTTGEAPLSFTG